MTDKKKPGSKYRWKPEQREGSDDGFVLGFIMGLAFGVAVIIFFQWWFS